MMFVDRLSIRGFQYTVDFVVFFAIQDVVMRDPKFIGGSFCRLFNSSAVNGCMGWVSRKVGMAVISFRLPADFPSTRGLF